MDSFTTTPTTTTTTTTTTTREGQTKLTLEKVRAEDRVARTETIAKRNRINALTSKTPIVSHHFIPSNRIIIAAHNPVQVSGVAGYQGSGVSR